MLSIICKYNKKRRQTFVLLIFFIAFLSNSIYAQEKNYKWVNVVRVVDGGTIKTVTDDGQLETIRLIGVDAPLTAFYDLDTDKTGESIFVEGRKAKDYLASLIDKKKIKLTFDSAAQRDEIGDTLAYVWCNNEMVNDKLLKEGYAYLDVEVPFDPDYKKQFWIAEQYAIENQVGLWDFKDFVKETAERIPPKKIASDETLPEMTAIPYIVGETDRGMVTRVIDGDTIEIELKGITEKVRLIGINTPETKHPFKKVEYFGKEATDYTKKHLEGKQVTLTYDLTRRDRYGRLLAYVWIGKLLYNNMIIRDGFSYAYMKYPFRDDFMKMFRDSQRYALIKKLGLWGNYKVNTAGLALPESQESVVEYSQKIQPTEKKPEIAGKYVGNKDSKVFHNADCQHVKTIKTENLVYFQSKEEALSKGYRACKVCYP